MDQKWSQNPQKSPPEGDLKTESPKMMKNDPKMLPKGSQMETPGLHNFGNGRVGSTLSNRTCPYYGTHELTYRSLPPKAPIWHDLGTDFGH